MRSRVSIVAPFLILAGCGGDSAELAGQAAPPAASAPTPVPPPTPTPVPVPTPTSTPSPTPAGYLTFAEILSFRLGASLSLPSGCAGFAFAEQPPATLPVTAYGRGLSFRYVVTPQVWSIGGDVSAGFDGRDGVTPGPGEEVALARTVGADLVRFAVVRPVAAGAGLEYTRLASVSAPVGGTPRSYQCVLGVPTLPADIASSPSGASRRGVLLATAYVGQGSAVRAYSLERSVVSASADPAAGRVTISVRLIGTAAGVPDLELGTLATSTSIDPATGDFAARLNGGDRTVDATVSGRFFGPRAVEIGAALGGTVAEAGGASGYSFAGTVYAAR